MGRHFCYWTDGGGEASFVWEKHRHDNVGAFEGAVHSTRFIGWGERTTTKNADKEMMVLWGAAAAHKFNAMGGPVSIVVPHFGEDRPLADTAVAADSDCMASVDGDAAVADTSLC